MESPDSTTERQGKEPDWIHVREDFEDVYANNVFLETSQWDLRILFGQLNQTIGDKRGTILHTAVTVPWLQAKLMAFYIQANVALYEAEHGTIKVPEHLMPQEPFRNTPIPQTVAPYIEELREHLLLGFQAVVDDAKPGEP